MTKGYLEDIYQDDFPQSKVPLSTAYAATKTTSDFSEGTDGISGGTLGNSAELFALKREKEALQARNGELMRILVANCLHYWNKFYRESL